MHFLPTEEGRAFINVFVDALGGIRSGANFVGSQMQSRGYFFMEIIKEEVVVGSLVGRIVRQVNHLAYDSMTKYHSCREKHHLTKKWHSVPLFQIGRRSLGVH